MGTFGNFDPGKSPPCGFCGERGRHICSAFDNLPAAFDNLPAAFDNLPAAFDNLPAAFDNLPEVTVPVRTTRLRWSYFDSFGPGLRCPVCGERGERGNMHACSGPRESPGEDTVSTSIRLCDICHCKLDDGNPGPRCYICFGMLNYRGGAYWEMAEREYQSEVERIKKLKDGSR